MEKIFGKTKQIHFIGIGGIGMSGMAELLYNHGFRITGSDMNQSERTDHLKSIGITIFKGHNKKNISSADLIVYSSAVNTNNPEIIEGNNKNIPVIKRAELLGEIIKIKRASLAIAGTHGKTTTSSMVGNILYEAKLDPTIITGGIVNKFNSNNISGSGDFIVVEADEFDRSFLHLEPTYISINNIELEHLDIYKNLDDLKSTFIKFANTKPFYGATCIGIDSKYLNEILPHIKGTTKTFAINQKADIIAKNIKYINNKSSFDVLIQQKKAFKIELIVPGLHNIYNALSAISLCLEIDIDVKYIIKGLNKYCGVKRRFEIKYNDINDQNIMIIDDYAHHPSEIKTTIDAIKFGWPNRRIISVFQPHLFTRTKDFYKDFSQSLMLANYNIIAPIYPAREKPLKNVTSALIQRELEKLGHMNSYDCSNINKIPDMVNKIVKEDDIIIVMGAGDIYQSIELIYSKIHA